MVNIKKRIKNSVVLFLILSGIVHLFTVSLINLTTDSTKLQTSVRETIEFEITAKQPEKLRLIEQDEKPVNDEIPEDAKFLGKHNQKVIKETRAKNFGDFRNSQGSGTNPMSQTQHPAQAAKSKKSSSSDKGTLPSLTSLNPKFDFNERRQETQNSSAAASATNDHLKDVHTGIETLLSSREFVYYTYYQRIRSQIRQHWEPSIREKVRRIFAQGRTIASTRDHVTRVIIILNKEGELIGVQIVGKSGVKDLDDAAVEAFRAAQPFPNPPKGIVDADGTIKINWDFILEA